MKKKFDIVPFPEMLEDLFILESPHTNEMKSGIGAMGNSGFNMSENLLKNTNQPFGKFLDEKDIKVKKYGLFNSCHFPLKLGDCLTSMQKKLAELKRIEDSEFINQEIRFRELLSVLREFTIEELEELTEYRKRLEEILEKCPKLKRIIVCGFIAQSFFLHYHYHPNKIPSPNCIPKTGSWI